MLCDRNATVRFSVENAGTLMTSFLLDVMATCDDAVGSADAVTADAGGRGRVLGWRLRGKEPILKQSTELYYM